MDQSTLSRRQAGLEFFRPRPDGQLDPAGEAGWYLQRERERHALTFDDVAAATGIHPYHLEAIEAGDLTGLPARGEALAMIGAYGDYLGFDPQPLVLHFANFLPASSYPDRARRKNNPKPLGSARIIDFAVSRRLRDMATGAGGIVASCLVAVALFGFAAAWLAPTSQETAVFPDEVPVASIAKIDEEKLPDDQPAQPGGLQAEADKAANALNGLGELIEGGFTNGEVSDLKTNIVPKESERVNGPERGRVHGAEQGESRLELKAKAPVWLRIEDRAGNIVFTATLNAGDSYRVPDRDDLIVISRDGGNISYSIDGKVRGDLGRPGEILVGRPLDVKKLAGR